MKIPLATQISNKFSDGYYRDFEEAISALRTAYRCEMSMEETDKDKEFWRREIEKCEKAENIYDRNMVIVKEKIVKELRQEGLDDFADALESGDYSSFAF